MPTRRYLLLPALTSLLSLLHACAAPPPPAAPPPSAPVEHAGERARPAETAESEKELAPPPASEKSSFRSVGSIPDAVQIFARAPGEAWIARATDVVGALRGGTLQETPKMVRRGAAGRFGMNSLLALAPGAGEDLWGSWIFQDGRMGATWLERWDGSQWKSANVRTPSAFVIAQIVKTTDERVLALQQPQMGPMGGFAKVLVLSGKATSAPRIGRRSEKMPPYAFGGCAQTVIPEAMLPLDDGAVALVGTRCSVKEDDEHFVLAVERFDKAGKSLGVREIDPGLTSPDASAHLAVVSLPGGPLVLQIDEWRKGAANQSHVLFVRPKGDDVSVVKMADHADHAEGFAADTHGNVYFAAPKAAEPGAAFGVFRSDPTGAVTPLVLPLGAEVRGAAPGIVATSPDDVWVFTFSGGSTGVWRNKTDAQAISGTFADDAATRSASEAGGGSSEPPTFAKAFGPSCGSPFVLLFTLAKTAAADYDFPSTRDAVKGHTELAGARFFEFSRGGKRYFGASVPTGEMGKKLVKIVSDKVKGSTPQLVCDAPSATRIVDIDLATGKINAGP